MIDRWLSGHVTRADVIVAAALYVIFSSEVLSAYLAGLTDIP